MSKIIEVPDKATFDSFVMDISNAEEEEEELGYKPEYTYIKIYRGL